MVWLKGGVWPLPLSFGEEEILHGLEEPGREADLQRHHVDLQMLPHSDTSNWGRREGGRDKRDGEEKEREGRKEEGRSGLARCL